MVFLDLFPAGIWQFNTVTESGLWYARSHHFVESRGFQTFTWMRAAGGTLFVLGGVIPLMWFITTRRKRLKEKKNLIQQEQKTPNEENSATVATN